MTIEEIMSNPCEDEIDAIRDMIYEEIKDMSPSEHTEYVRQKTAPIIKQFHLKVAKNAWSEAVYPYGR